jgi:hypothetical protein
MTRRDLSPAALRVARLRRERAEAEDLAQVILAALPDLAPGQEASVTVEGRWGARAVVLAADLLGEAGWRRVELRHARGGGAVCAMMQMPPRDVAAQEDR